MTAEQPGELVAIAEAGGFDHAGAVWLVIQVLRDALLEESPSDMVATRPFIDDWIDE